MRLTSVFDEISPQLTKRFLVQTFMFPTRWIETSLVILISSALSWSRFWLPTIKWTRSTAILTFKMRALLIENCICSQAQPASHQRDVLASLLGSCHVAALQSRVEEYYTAESRRANQKLNVWSRRPSASPSKRIITRCLEVFWI